ncbi:MAG TPA: DHA2 family efflux MFS transporter permease subunit [Caulobacteraceae bacterium]|nr:DHA2 family efflux MFS transporter permease subunit [Caulobacteraceae bacterium]
MSAASPTPAEPPPLQGAALILAGFLLAAGNFMVVLDMTIANVSVPTIAGGLAVSPSEGTWVITSYSIAEAIVVPLTGWLAQRFGAVRTWIAGMVGFGVCSALCGLAPSLGALVAFRVLQGLCGGPIMPMSQTLMMRVFPPQARAQAMGVWSMTIVVAPIAGPILGGTLCDTVGWPWIFYINVPVAAVCAFFAWRMLRARDTAPERRRIDLVGLGLLVTFVGATQVLLDRGKELDWFGSSSIRALAVIAVLGFCAFLIWELTDAEPIVDLRVFRHRGFAAAVITITLTYGAFFASIVLMPLWLQTNMGYTATWSGYAAAFGGVLAVVASPIVPRLMGRFDTRALVSFGIVWMAAISLLRARFASNADFWSIAVLFLAQGLAMPFFFVPTTQLSLSSVLPQETAAAAGLQNFLRTMSAAFSTSLITTFWDDAGARAKVHLAGALNDPAAAVAALRRAGLGSAQALGQLDALVQSQAVMLATNHMFEITTVIFLVGAAAIWFAPKMKWPVVMAGGH